MHRSFFLTEEYTLGSQTFLGMVPKAIEQHGMPYRMVSECWLGANVIGKVPIPAIDCFSHFSPLEGVWVW